MVFVNSWTTLADLCGTADDVIVSDPLQDRTVADLCNTLEEVEILAGDPYAGQVVDPQEMAYYEELLEAQEREHASEVVNFYKEQFARPAHERTDVAHRLLEHIDPDQVITLSVDVEES